MHIGSGEGWIDVTLNIVSAQGRAKFFGGEKASWRIDSLEFGELHNIYKYVYIYVCIMYVYIYIIEVISCSNSVIFWMN